eukprot:TRINITY_DN2402_c2_g3_i1.p1 TRINITY_DN2402_c2_g3~~TRINITY_DN2402_c2_g3_i1.p1  ORF type:complete len:103 (+),score=37.55 TRINITY_DN2402_c2_g3_i1:2-310(+)
MRQEIFSNFTLTASAASTSLLAMNVDEEIDKLKEEMLKLGEKQPDGSVKVKFGKLFDETGDIFEALGGTLRAAKKRKIVTFAAEMLLQGRDNNVDIVLLPSS